jgi:hypothetical protein
LAAPSERGSRPQFETSRYSSTPFAGLLGSSWPIKFEGQFKYRDESKMNAKAAATSGKSQKCPFDGDYSQIVRFGLPCRFVKR